MAMFPYVGKKLQHLCSSSCQKLACLTRSIWCIVSCFYRFILLRANSFSIHICYFVSLSSFGFWVLKVLKPRTHDSFTPRNLDLFFTSVSAATVSSMSTVEMEVFSNSQLIVLTILMFVGGEVCTSMVGLHFGKSRLERLWKLDEKVASVRNDLSLRQMELGVVKEPDSGILEPAGKELAIVAFDQTGQYESSPSLDSNNNDQHFLKYNAIRVLGFVVLGYLVVVQVIGTALVSLYMGLVSSAKNVLKNKGLKMFTFSFFTSVSTFASCGFVPTNENMMVFSKNSGLLLILIPQVLLGNTLFPSCLRFCIWLFGKFFKKPEFEYLLRSSEIGYLHLLPSLHSWYLVVTVFGFILVQFVLFCAMEWDSGVLSGLNSYEKIIGVLFQTVNTRHTGETIVDLSAISRAILVLFVLMMYLPPYTSFLPVKDGDDEEQYQQLRVRRKRRRRGIILENLIFSQLSYLVIFIILVCITERQKIKEDPLNFSVLNIAVEVISAYGNVGFTTGYSCARQLNSNSDCKDQWFGFSGKWTDQGKIILILVMFFGRLKKFNIDGGRAWLLL